MKIIKTFAGFIRFVKPMFKADPSKRPTIEKILKDKFLADYVEEVRAIRYTEEELR